MLEEEMGAHSSVLALRIPWAKEPGRLQSMGLQNFDMTEQLLLAKFKVHSKEMHSF